MEQLVILLIIGAISLINWLLQKSAEHKQRRGGQDGPEETSRDTEISGWEESVSPTAGQQDSTTQEEQMRRFFEALGLPSPQESPQEPVITPSFETEPPPLPNPAPARRAAAKPASAPSFLTPSATSPTMVAKPTLRENREMKELAAKFEASELDAASTTGTQAVFRNLLADPHGARQAIILQEILNPPRALRPYSA
jgi:hypothetical protein